MRDATAACRRQFDLRACGRVSALAMLLAGGVSATAPQAMALSVLGETPQRQAPAVADQKRLNNGEILEAFDATILPQPTPAIDRPAGAAKDAPKAPVTGPTPAAPSQPAPATGNSAAPTADPKDEAQIIRDLSTLPAPVRKAREEIVEAAASGDIERLRPLMQHGADHAQVMNGEEDDPIDTLKSFSGDPDGQEILAIILDLLATGVARFDAGTPQEMYVWPYFAGKPLDKLTPPERVELLRIVTAGDLAGMQESGSYNFYRMGISPDGHWKYIVGGD